ncbi:MAG TPA: chemotaxis protein CheW [Candidatus Acidoferrales bacterium]|nr:chemotaxis protein CheW [Candidatus Acidoferrales bacterium]
MNGAAQNRPPVRMPAPQKQEPVIVFAVSGVEFAIPAAAVHEIRSTDSLAGEAAMLEQPDFPWVRHSIERSGTVQYVVSMGTFFGLGRTRPSLVLVLRGVRCALLVDRIERMDALSSIQALPRAFRGQERRWYLGLALFADGVVPMVNPQGFLTAAHLERLDAHVAAGAVPA